MPNIWAKKTAHIPKYIAVASIFTAAPRGNINDAEPFDTPILFLSSEIAVGSVALLLDVAIARAWVVNIFL